MRTKTELLLYMISWRKDQLFHASHPPQQSFEGWAYQNGFPTQIETLKAKGYLQTRSDLSPFLQLTQTGQLAAQGGLHPQQAWSKRWDHIWHMLIFDLPAEEKALRKNFLRTLKIHGFGCLQGSVWVSPRFPTSMSSYLKNHPSRPCRLLHLKSNSEGKRKDQCIIRDAWNFDLIADLYQELLEILHEFPQVENADQLLDWAQREWNAWKSICEKDPMLPRSLHPTKYPGPKVWKKRQQVLSQAGRLATELFVAPATNNVEMKA
ncbi:hypothetical protein P0Y35_14740 [Kiritimatiellaeota bacterium B1221]|nr:hypothetical protein [Kiritimatiellaeota bacterium B1221]